MVTNLVSGGPNMDLWLDLNVSSLMCCHFVIAMTTYDQTTGGTFSDQVTGALMWSYRWRNLIRQILGVDVMNTFVITDCNLITHHLESRHELVNTSVPLTSETISFYLLLT